ncbi:MAG: DEAD/DEAH box helicase family protein [Chloroflexota bacterium]|nr:DEAD/DEAH box helicase family protein [Chloroflexota bacterium]
MFNEFSRYEEDFARWRDDGYPGTRSQTYEYIGFLTDPEDDSRPRAGTLWTHQWESFLRVIYCYEILGKQAIGGDGLLLNIVTGGGKTAVIAAIVAWLRIAHDLRRFVLMCPNLIVRDRLQADFEKGRVFGARDLLPNWSSARPSDFTLTTLGGGADGGAASLLGADVVLGNIHQFYRSSTTGKRNLAALMNGPDFALFNDEAHNSPAPEYEETLKAMSPKTIVRIDTTATPDRADGKTPDSSMIYEYGVADALADVVIKTPVVYQPDIRTVELTYTDAVTGEHRKVEEIDWDEVDRKGISATQWVTDDEPMRQQMAIGLKRLQEQETRAKKRYQPILFVVAVCKADAEKAANTLNKYFKIKTLLVTEDSDEADRKRATELGRQQRSKDPYRAVVSVLMLREGWDVPEVGVIVLLRKFSSQVYGQQVIGRGLRRVRVTGVGDDEPQICAVVDHPKLDHEWLWKIFGSRVRKNVEIDQEFDETEDLPEPLARQEMKRPDLIVDLPGEIEGQGDDGKFEVDVPEPPAPLADWRAALAAIEYESTTMEITRVDIEAVVGTELSGSGWKMVHSAPEKGAIAEAYEISDASLRDAIKSRLLDDSEELAVEAGYAATLKGVLYSALLAHVREKFLSGSSIGLAEHRELAFAFKKLPEMRRKVAAVPGLVAGILEYGDQ